MAGALATRADQARGPDCQLLPASTTPMKNLSLGTTRVLGAKASRACYELIGRHDLPGPLFWGYWPGHVKLARFTPYVAPVERGALPGLCGQGRLRDDVECRGAVHAARFRGRSNLDAPG